MCAITRHGEKRTRERVGVPKSAVRRTVDRALEHGINRTETDGGLRRYLDKLYYSGGSDNIVIYGDKIYIFGNAALITVFTVPAKYRDKAARLLKKKRQ